jgi:hypothetical protein
MMKYLEWSEPWQYGDEPTEWVEVLSRMTVKDAIKYQRGLYTNVYKDKCDDYPLEDFIADRWAKIVEG